MTDPSTATPAPDVRTPGAPAPTDAAGLLPLQVRGLAYGRNGTRLIDGIDLDIHAGTRTFIMGPNGAGKSLLLRLLHGLLEPSAGTVRWGGEADPATARQRQAMVFQRPVLLRRSVAANIDFALGLRDRAAAGSRTQKRTERRDALLRHVGLDGRQRQPARQLSGGEQQRLALARALATDPEILFLDEPTASLDPASVLKIEEIVLQAHAAGTKIIFVSHDIGQARRMADDIVFLHRGRLVEQAVADRFFDAPATDAARRYLEGQIVL